MVRLVGGAVLSGALDFVTAKTLFLSDVCVPSAAIVDIKKCEV